MIIDWLLGLLMDLLDAMIGLLPAWSWAGEEGSGNWLASFYNIYRGINTIIPLDLMFRMLVWVIGFEVMYATVSYVVFIYNRIRGA